MPPPTLGSFLNLSALASHPGLVTEVLLRASAEIPALRPAALAANVIGGLDNAPHAKSAALLSLLHSVPFQQPLNAHPPERYAPVFRALQLPGPLATLPLDQALSEFSSVLFSLESPWLRPMLSGVVQAGGLGPLALAIERHALGTSDDDYRAAKAELRRLEAGAKDFLKGWKKVQEIEVPGTDAFRARAGALTPAQIKKMKSVAGLGSYFAGEFPSSAFPEGRSPAHWTDYLLKRPGRSPGEGSCSPRHGIYAHLSLLAGVDVQPVFYPQHVNAYDAELDLVFDVSFLPYFSTLDEWRACRFLGSGEAAAPTYAFLWSVIVNLGVESELTYLKTAAQVHEGSAHHLAYLGLENYERPEGRFFAGQAMSKNSLHPLPHALVARALGAEGRFSEAVAAFERARELVIENPRPKAPTGIVADLGVADVVGLSRHLVVFLMQARRFSEAARVLEGILELAPDHYEAMVHLGTVVYWQWTETPETERSEAALERAEALLTEAISSATAGSPFLADAHRNLQIIRKSREASRR